MAVNGAVKVKTFCPNSRAVLSLLAKLPGAEAHMPVGHSAESRAYRAVGEIARHHIQIVRQAAGKLTEASDLPIVQQAAGRPRPK